MLMSNKTVRLVKSTTTVELPIIATRPAIDPSPTMADAPAVDCVALIFPTGKLMVSLECGDEIILGRLHPSNKIQPQVDLTEFGGGLHGASRLHAALRHDDDQWWIEDLDSSNGTWVDGERLAPYCPCRLNAKSKVTLANLEVEIILPAEGHKSLAA